MSINLAVIEQIAEITLDQPEALNALSPADLAELSCVLVKARDNPDVRVILLKGAGERAFCTGANLKGTLPTETPFVNGFFSSREQRSDEPTSELQSLMRISYAVFCLKTNNIPLTIFTNA